MKRPVSCEKGRATGAGTAGVYRLNWRRTSAFMFTVPAFQIAILGPFQVQAQIPDGTLSGMVTCSSGSLVPNARLIIKNDTSSERRSDTRSVTVNIDGTYVVANLSPGTYEITAWAKGFADAHATVAISVDGEPVVNLVMQAAGPTTAGQRQAGSSTVKGDGTASVSELPLNGRSASDEAPWQMQDSLHQPKRHRGRCSLR